MNKPLLISIIVTTASGIIIAADVAPKEVELVTPRPIKDVPRTRVIVAPLEFAPIPGQAPSDSKYHLAPSLSPSLLKAFSKPIRFSMSVLSGPE